VRPGLKGLDDFNRPTCGSQLCVITCWHTKHPTGSGKDCQLRLSSSEFTIGDDSGLSNTALCAVDGSTLQGTSCSHALPASPDHTLITL